MQLSTLSNLKLDDSKEFEILDPLTGKRSQTYNPKTKKLEDTPAFISLFYMGSKKMKKVQLELQRKIIELAKDKKDAPTEKEVEDMLFFEMIDSYRGFKDGKGKELEFNEENTRLLLEAPYIRHLIEEVSSKMGNFSMK